MKKILSITLLCTSVLAIGVLSQREVGASSEFVKSEVHATSLISPMDMRISDYIPNGDFQTGGLSFWKNNRNFKLKYEGSNTYLSTIKRDWSYIDAQRIYVKSYNDKNLTLTFDSRNSETGYVMVEQRDRNDNFVARERVDGSPSKTWTKSVKHFKLEPETDYFLLELELEIL